MPTFSIEYTTENERLQYEQAIAYVQEIIRLGHTAGPGTVIDTCEQFAIQRGRQLLLNTLEAAIQARADAEKKSPDHAPKVAKRGRSSRPSDRSR